MNLIRSLSHHLNFRREETKIVATSFLGCLFCSYFLILSGALRDSLFYTNFRVTNLPYITFALVGLGLPGAALYSRFNTRFSPQFVFKFLLILLSAGLILLAPFLDRHRFAVVLFYLWTALGSSALLAGFWGLMSEYFGIRGAKRLFGLISGGGSVGALLAGFSIYRLSKIVEVTALVPLLIVSLGMVFVLQFLNPQPAHGMAADVRPEDIPASLREGAGWLWKDGHLRKLILIIMASSACSLILDFQFMEWVTRANPNRSELAAFLGIFEAVTSVGQILLLLVLTPRLIAWIGVGGSLAVVPLLLVAGSAAFFLLPSLALITVYGGVDYMARNAIHKPLMEVLFVPLPVLLRRKTKPWVDSLLNGIAEGAGAGLIFLWVTWGALPSRYLSCFVMVLAVWLLVLSRSMGRQYFSSLVDRLREGESLPQGIFLENRAVRNNLLGSTFSHLEFGKIFQDIAPALSAGFSSGPSFRQKLSQPPTIAELLAEGEPDAVARLLATHQAWGPEHLPPLLRLLARSSDSGKISEIVAGMAPSQAPALADMLADPRTEFVIRRRIPRILGGIGGRESDTALLAALTYPRFEVRYRCAIALVRRRKRGLLLAEAWKPKVWAAIRSEIEREKPVWEMQVLLDKNEAEDIDYFFEKKINARGALSLEHTFRLFALVLEPEIIEIAYRGIMLDHPILKSFALEYLEHVLPREIQLRLWPFIGDLSEHQRERQSRKLEEVVGDLINMATSLFPGEGERKEIRALVEKIQGVK